MRKFQITEIAFNMSTGASTTRVVAKGLNRKEAMEKSFVLRHKNNGGEIARAYEIKAEKDKLEARGWG